MNIPIKHIIKDSKNKKDLEEILLHAEESFNSWKTTWTKFISPALKEELFEKLKPISDLKYYSNGGFKGAERQRICFSRKERYLLPEEISPPMNAIYIQGNFLFDRAEKSDFIKTLKSLGERDEEIGDIWLVRDRGAQAICTPETSIRLNKKISLVREVEVKFQALEIHELNLPSIRTPKTIKSVEASTRLDAIASAGFGMSRSKITSLIKEGKVTLNWQKITQANRSISKGDRIQLEQKGSIQIQNIEITKRGRWKVELLRQ